MKTRLPNQYKNLPGYNYQFKLVEGLYFTLDLKMIKLNCKNYFITSRDEVTIQAIDEFSILTIRASRKSRAQYLITKKLKVSEIIKIPERYLPENFKEYLKLALKSIEDYDLLVKKTNSKDVCYHPKT